MGGVKKMPEIKWEEFEKLCNIQCTEEEIAWFFGISISYLKKKVKEQYDEPFDVVYKKYQAGGKVSIRRSQFYLKNKSSAMAMFLGKVYLGQRETTPEENAPTIQVVGDVKLEGCLASNETLTKEDDE